jgi:hypothetical protein
MTLRWEKIGCEKYNWNISVYLKAIALLFYCSLVTQRIVAFCVSKVTGTKSNTTQKSSGLNGNHLFQDRKM